MVTTKESYSLHPVKLTRKTYSNGKLLEPGSSYVMQEAKGRGCWSLLTSYGRPRPKGWSINPVEHRTFEGWSGPATLNLYNTPYYIYPAKLNCQLSGDIAALCKAHRADFALQTYDSWKLQDAVMQAASKLLEPDVGYGMMVAEAAETAKMLINPVNYLVKQCKRLLQPRTLRRPRNTSLQTRLQYAADAWLGLRYGIMPTVGDVSDIINEYEEVIQPRKEFYRKGGGSPSRETVERGESVAAMLGTYTRYEWELRTVTSYVSHLWYKILDYAAHERIRLNYHWSQIPNLVWEIVPFSFLVDWTFQVGPWLSAMMPHPAYAKLGQTASVTVKRTGLVQCRESSIYSGFLHCTANPSNYSWEERFYIRAVNPSLPALPPVNVDFRTLQRDLDSAALAFKPMTNLIKSIIK